MWFVTPLVYGLKWSGVGYGGAGRGGHLEEYDEGAGAGDVGDEAKQRVNRRRPRCRLRLGHPSTPYIARHEMRLSVSALPPPSTNPFSEFVKRKYHSAVLQQRPR